MSLVGVRMSNLLADQGSNFLGHRASNLWGDQLICWGTNDPLTDGCCTKTNRIVAVLSPSPDRTPKLAPGGPYKLKHPFDHRNSTVTGSTGRPSIPPVRVPKKLS